MRLVEGNLGRACFKSSAVERERWNIEAPCRIFEDQQAVIEAFRAGELERDVVVVVRFQGPRANGMPELHKLTPALGVLQDKGYRVALLTDGRMSGASGKVPAVIHLSPEALPGPDGVSGPLAYLKDGDLVRVCAVNGEAVALVDEAEWASRAPAIAPPPAGGPHEQVQLSAMRRTIARRLSHSKQTIPHFYLSVRCRLDPLLQLRARVNAELGGRGPRLSVNDFLLKALAVAAEREPQVNVQFAGDRLYRFGRVDVAVAVAVDGGLFTPVIRDAARLSVSAIARQMQDLGARGRAGKLLPEEYQGGTLSLSNLGMFGMDEMWPVINPPQAMILGVAAGVEQPWKVDGTVGLATIMTATAGFDHRAIDGADASRFMAAFRALVEDPLGSLV
jgi:hypothetical protein